MGWVNIFKNKIKIFFLDMTFGYSDDMNNRALGRTNIRDSVELFGLKQLISEPTRYGTKPSTIGYIYID